MSSLDDLAAYLAGGGIGGAVGSVIFKGSLPDDPDRVLVIYQNPGAAPTYTQASIGPAYERPAIQIVARDKLFADAEQLAYEAWAALGVITNAILSGNRYLSVRPSHSPVLIRRDTNNRPLIGFNALVEKEASLVVVS